MAGFGTGVIPPRPDRRLTSDALRLPARDLPKVGRTVELQWPGVAHAFLARPSPTRAVISMAGGIEVEIELKQWPMPVVRFRQRGVRTRFVCRCGASRDAIHYLPEAGWGCRGADCLNLAFASRHRQRYCPSIARRARLRRKLIRAIPGSLKARALRKMIAREERAMLAHLQRVNIDLAKRSKRDARSGRASPE